MKLLYISGAKQWISLAIACGILGGSFFCLRVFPNSFVGVAGRNTAQVKRGWSASDERQGPVVAEQYATAIRDGRAAEAVAMTRWMKERLSLVRLKTGDAEAVEAERMRLCGRLCARPIEDNQLRPEGVEDPFVFSPCARVKCIACDSGRTDLACPVEQRQWLRVLYTNKAHALRDVSGKAIRAITVGVNVSREGEVLKAGVIGNLDIDRASISYDWDGAPGGKGWL